MILVERTIDVLKMSLWAVRIGLITDKIPIVRQGLTAASELPFMHKK